MKTHNYSLTVAWTGNKGEGTNSYGGYSRSHTISIEGKAMIEGSSDPHFLGDATKLNPEELLLAALSSCHMLWYLHLCASAGVVVTSYADNAKGQMIETKNGSGKFESVTLNPNVVVKDDLMVMKAKALHSKANEYCFIANSVNFPVHHVATITAE